MFPLEIVICCSLSKKKGLPRSIRSDSLTLLGEFLHHPLPFFDFDEGERGLEIVLTLIRNDVDTQRRTIFGNNLASFVYFESPRAEKTVGSLYLYIFIKKLLFESDKDLEDEEIALNPLKSGRNASNGIT